MKLGEPTVIVEPGVRRHAMRVVRDFFGSTWTLPLSVLVVKAHAVQSDRARGFGAFTPTGLRRPSKIVTKGPTIVLPGLLGRRDFLTTMAHEVAHFDEWRGGRVLDHGKSFQRRNKSRRASILREYLPAATTNVHREVRKARTARIESEVKA